jgi:hypothetical protein
MPTWNSWRLASALGLAILFVPGCGGSGSTGPTPTPTATPAPATTFTGTIAGSSGQSGTLVVRIAAATATATLTPIDGGGTFALTGTFDEATKTLTLSGSGFALKGTIANGKLTGNYTGPGGSVGIFSNLNSTSQSVQPYCGTYHRVTEDGVWNFGIAASGEVSGGGIAKTGPSSIGALPFFITGTRSGNTLSLTVHTDHDGDAAVTGTIQGSSVGGSYIDNEGLPGTFTGGTC